MRNKSVDAQTEKIREAVLMVCSEGLPIFLLADY